MNDSPVTPLVGGTSLSRPSGARTLAYNVVTLCLAIVVPVLALAGALAWAYVQSEHARLGETGLDAARIVAHVVDRELARFTASGETLARSQAIEQNTLDRFAIRARDEQAILGARLTLIDPTGRVLVDSSTGPFPDRDTGLDVGMGATPGSPGWILVTDSRLPGPTLQIDIPTRRAGAITGFLRLRLAAAHIHDLVVAASGGAGWTASVMDRVGNPIASSTTADMAALWPGQFAQPEGLITGVTPPNEQTSVIGAYSHVASAGWTVVVTAPSAEVNEPIHRSGLAFAGLATVLLALTGLLALRFGRRIADPVRMLATAAERLGQGEAVEPFASGITDIDALAVALAVAASERRTAEARLRDSEARFRTLFEAAPVAVALIDPETLRFVAWNDLACEKLGYTPDELGQLRILDVDVAMRETDLLAMVRGGGTQPIRQVYETRYRTRAGEVRDVLLRARPIAVGADARSYLAWIDITERRVRDRELQEMAERQAAILDALPAHIALLDHAGRIVAVNEAWRRFGATTGAASSDRDWIGADYLSACAPAVQDGDPTAIGALEGLQGILAGKRDRAELVYPCDTADGEEQWFQFVAVPDRAARAARKAAVGAVVMHVDVTQRVLAEQKLAESEARLRLFIERAPAAIAVFDLEMRYLAASRRYMADYRLEDAASGPVTIIGRSHYEVFPEIPNHWIAAHRRVLSGGETLVAEEETFVRADGQVDWVRWEMTPWRRRDGSIGGALLFSEVITARKTAENALRASAAWLRSILETVPDAMVVIDDSGTIHSFSTTAERLFGWSAQDVIGRDVSLLMPEAEGAVHAAHVDRYLRTGQSVIMGADRIVFGRRRDDTTFPLSITVNRLNVDGNRLFTGFIRDLTERQATQARLQELQAELAHYSRLGAAGAMASALAHELNQPLTATISAVRAARRMLAMTKVVDAPEFLTDAMDLAAEQALRAGEIIRRLRDFVARGGELDVSLESLPLLIEEAGALGLLGAKEGGIQVTFDNARDLPLVLADRVQVQQVLVNLMRNAVQAMTAEAAGPEGSQARSHAIVVTTRRRDVRTVEVSVADTGSGLPESIQARLFEPFVTTKPGGMGVGLSICRSIVEAHGGKLWAEPNPGGGTIFRFTLQTAALDPAMPEDAVE